jgi:signal transduction histidine kinase
MIQVQRPASADRRLSLLKWLMVFIPPAVVTLGHVVLEYRAGLLGPGLGGHPENPLLGGLVVLGLTLVALMLAYVFVEALFRVLRRLQAEAQVREQDMLVMAAVMQERERLSRELHDGVAQLVADLLVRLDTIGELVEADRRQAAQGELERLRGVAEEIYDDIGESISGLRTDIDERGLAGALTDYVDQFEERHLIATSLRVDDAIERIPHLAAVQLFRFIQEALTNVRKHAGARTVTVTLAADGPDRIGVAVADDGRGFNPGSEAGGTGRPLGLTSMRERVEGLGGSFRVDSRRGSGTRVTATIPIRPVGTRSRDATVAPAAG